MKVEGAHPNVGRQLLETRHGWRCLDETASLRDLYPVLLGQGWLIGLAPLARAEAGVLGVFPRRVKPNVFRFRQPGWT
jgi:hypothetical protein